MLQIRNNVLIIKGLNVEKSNTGALKKHAKKCSFRITNSQNWAIFVL